MITYSHPKINIGLYIIKKREDGFHDIETIFYPIMNQMDIISISRIEAGIELEVKGPVQIENNESNLCIKAVRLIQKSFPSVDGLRIELTKNVPIGAGLGGGSANGATVLKIINKMYTLGLSIEELKRLALELGSDVPFFIEEKPSYGTGKGEILEPIDIQLVAKKISVIKPSISISTGMAYQNCTPQKSPYPLKEAIHFPIKEWKNLIFNDFEKVLFPKYPELEEIKQKLYREGAEYVSLSGSGSALYAIGDKEYNL